MKKMKYSYINYLLIIVVLGILLFSYLTSHVDNVKINNETITPINTGWISYNENGAKLNITLPINIKTTKNKVTTITNKIIDQKDDQVISFRTADQLLKVYFNGKETYSFGYNNTRLFGKTPGSSWHFIQIPSTAYPCEVKIEFSSPYNNFGGNLPQIYIGTKTASIFHVVNDNLLGFIISFILLLIGITHVILYFVVRKLNMHATSLKYLGQFTIIMALASMIETRLLQLYIGNQSFLSNFIFLLNKIAPIFILLYLSETFFYHSQKKYHILANIFIFNLIICAILNVLNIQDFMETNWATNLLILFICIYIFIDLTKLVINNKRNPRMISIFIALIVLSLSIFVDIFNFYIRKIGDVTHYQRFGLLYFIFTLSLLDFRKLLSLMKQGMEASALRRIAYYDILTKCKNRFYFEESFITLRKKINNYNNVVIAIFDINNLKLVNDFKGHLQGDTLIVHAAQLINECFSEYANICRIGGDEFAFVVANVPKEKMQASFDHFLQSMNKQNELYKIELDIAYGYAYYDPAIDEDLQATFNRADSNMYARKTEMKLGKINA